MVSPVQVRLMVGVGALCLISFSTSGRGVVAQDNNKCPWGCWDQGPTEHIAYFSGTEPIKCVLYTDLSENEPAHCSADAAYAPSAHWGAEWTRATCKPVQADEWVEKYITKFDVCYAGCWIGTSQPQLANPTENVYDDQ